LPGIALAIVRRMSKADELQTRVELFVDTVADFLKPIVITTKTARFISQLTGSSTSVGANYRAARRARSHAEFTARIGVVSEEADESEYWLARAIRHGYGDPATASRLHAEAFELMKIFGRSANTARSRNPQSPNRRSPGPQSHNPQ
jgi:four helix bundle protein